MDVKAADILDVPQLVAPLPYLNFLRYIKRQHPHYGLRRLLEEGLVSWNCLHEHQKNLFQRHRILARTARSSVEQRCRVFKLKRLKRKPGQSVRFPVYKKKLPMGEQQWTQKLKRRLQQINNNKRI